MQEPISNERIEELRAIVAPMMNIPTKELRGQWRGEDILDTMKVFFYLTEPAIGEAAITIRPVSATSIDLLVDGVPALQNYVLNPGTDVTMYRRLGHRRYTDEEADFWRQKAGECCQEKAGACSHRTRGA